MITLGSKTLGKTPFLRFSMALIAGIIITGRLVFIPAQIAIFVFLLVVLFSASIYLNNFKNKYSQFCSIVSFLFLFISGILLSHYHKQAMFDYNIPGKGIFTAHIIEKNRLDENRSRYFIKLDSYQIADSEIGLSEKILLTIADSTTNENLIPGNRIRFEASLNHIRNNNNPGDFNYQGYMARRGIRHQSFIRGEVEVLPDKKRTLRSVAFNTRTKMLEKYQNAGIDGDEFAVLAALTLGDKNYLTNNLRQSFASSGAMHVLAVSGLHVGIIYMMLNAMLTPVFRNKRSLFFKALILISLLWCYAFIAGMSPSVMRASTMFSFVIIGESLKRKTNIYNTLALSAFVLMLINPLIIYEVGFQLSYAAVTSIVFFQPKIASAILFKNRILKYMWELLAVSVAAQLGTFVISIYYFNQFPVYFWLSNYIVIPAAIILLYGAMVFFFLNFVPILPIIVARLIETVAFAMNKGVQAIEMLPGSIIRNIWVDEITMILLFAGILIVALFSANRSFKLVLSSMLIMIFLTSNGIYNHLKIARQSSIVFYNNYRMPLLGFVEGNTKHYYTAAAENNNNLNNTLNNAMSYFRTNEVSEIQSGINPPLSPVMHNQYIIHRGILLELTEARISNNTSSSKNNSINETLNGVSDLLWNTKTGDVLVLRPEKFDIYIFSKDEKTKTDITEKQSIRHNTRDGALLLNIK